MLMINPAVPIGLKNEKLGNATHFEAIGENRVSRSWPWRRTVQQSVAHKRNRGALASENLTVLHRARTVEDRLAARGAAATRRKHDTLAHRDRTNGT